MSSVNKDTLGDRMKSLESIETNGYFLPNTPLYARIDGRAFHTFCRSFKKPYSLDFIETMCATCKELHEKTGAICSYVQSDEISLGWVDISKAPFDGRKFKLISVLSSIATSAFMSHVFSKLDSDSEVTKATLKYHPTFDCRIFNIPHMGEDGLSELANCFIWRENDAIKNSVTGMALNFFSNSQIHKKNTDDKIEMMKSIGYNFYKDTPESFLRGTFFERVTYEKELSDEISSKIPEHKRCYDANGKIVAVRSEIRKKNVPYRLSDIQNKSGVLFYGESAILNKPNPTFILC